MPSHPGYHGRYLRIDLTDRCAETLTLRTDDLRDYIGGVGLGARLLLDESQPGQDPLSPGAPLIFVFSPLVGSPLTTSAKFAVVGHSPLTNRISDALSSSHFAINGKKTGCDAIVITGASEDPVTLTIDDGDVQFHDAADVWGQPSPKTGESLRAEHGSRFHFASIGPAGERLVRFATISNDGRHAGRGGLGAVMGSKRLKAIGVSGSQRVEYAHPQELIRYSKELSVRSMGPATAKYRELGTVSNLLTFNRLGTLPTRNFTQGEFAGAATLAPEAMSEHLERTRTSCAACTIGCEHLFHQPGKKTGVRMEYENLFALGPLCGVSEPEVVLEASSLCDEYGMDTISAGGTIAFAMECAERGMIDAPDLRFGNGAALLQALRDIGEQRGLGELLALGSRAAAHEIGQQSIDFAPQVKGLEIPGYEPRALQTMALGFAVGTRGADHNRSGAYQVDFSEGADRFHPDDSAILQAIDIENEAAIMDSLILCKFLRGVFEDRMQAMGEMLHMVTGWDVDTEELQQTAQRIIDAKKRFNIEQGWTPAEDTLPKRMLTEPLSGGSSAGAALDEATLRRQVEAYNLARGWTAEGWLDGGALPVAKR